MIGSEYSKVCEPTPRCCPRVKYRVLTHGGSTSTEADQDGTDRAATAGLVSLSQGGTPLDAVVAATMILEDDPRFNAGSGSNLRMDGETIQMDAIVMDSGGELGSVCCIERVRHPVQVARALTRTPHVMLSGEGAIQFARRQGFLDHDPITEKARGKFRRMKDELDLEFWTLDGLAEAWNYPTSMRQALGCDTVGAVATDGKIYATALSTGGTMAALLGRVGDSPLPGCGAFAGVDGAVAATGDGEFLIRKLLARSAYTRLEQGWSATEVVEEVLGMFDPKVDIGIIVLNKDSGAGGARDGMAWSLAAGD